METIGCLLSSGEQNPMKVVGLLENEDQNYPRYTNAPMTVFVPEETVATTRGWFITIFVVFVGNTCQELPGFAGWPVEIFWNGGTVWLSRKLQNKLRSHQIYLKMPKKIVTSSFSLLMKLNRFLYMWRRGRLSKLYRLSVVTGGAEPQEIGGRTRSWIVDSRLYLGIQVPQWRCSCQRGKWWLMAADLLQFSFFLLIILARLYRLTSWIVLAWRHGLIRFSQTNTTNNFRIHQIYFMYIWWILKLLEMQIQK